jgi:4-aminobutyrate aminotransferase/(S)-3-amino-2-methylpropionate transaminase
MLSWQERWPVIGDVRGLGAMLAIEFVSDWATRTPAPELARAVIDKALARGLLLISCGVHSNCIRELVPLVITDAELDEALAVWEEALAAALG